MWFDPGLPERAMGMGVEGVVEALLTLAIWLAFQVFIVVLGVAIAWRWLHRPGGLANATPRTREKTAFEILDERYARGEIEAWEYAERRDLLLGRRR